MTFKEWITKKLGYEIRNIDLANAMGETRGEIVRKWMIGDCYPNDISAVKLARFLKISEKEVRKAILEMKIEKL